MAFTHIQIWLMPKSMLLIAVVTTPYIGKWMVAVCEETRPQSVKALKQNQNQDRTQGPCVSQMLWSFSIHGVYLYGPCSFLPLSTTSWVPMPARSSTGRWDSVKTDRHSLRRSHANRSAKLTDHKGRHWLHRQRESLMESHTEYAW